MQNIELSIHQAFRGLAPRDWRLSKSVNIQRLYYIINGTGFMRANGLKPLHPGFFYLFPSNLHQEFQSDLTDPINHIYFDFYSTPPIIAPEPLFWDARDGTAAALAAFLGCSLTERTMNIGEGNPADAYQQLVVELLRISLMTLSGIRPIPYMTERIVSDTLSFIRENCDRPLRVSDMAARLGFEENYFIRRFRTLTGTTPYAYLKLFRLNRARTLIASGKTLAESAPLVGYENASSLSRALSGSRA